MTRTYLGDEIDWDVELVLGAGEVRRLQLKGGMRIGFNSWLMSASDRTVAAKSSRKNRRQVVGSAATMNQH